MSLEIENWEHLPTPVEIVWFTGFPDFNPAGNGEEVLAWIADNGGRASAHGRELAIHRHNGDFWTSPGDPIIHGHDREFYPTKEHLVRALYRRRVGQSDDEQAAVRSSRPTSTSECRGVTAPREFDWHAWLDRERQAAELRTGSDDPAVVVEDARYGRALELRAGREAARVALERAQRRLEAVERAAQAMAEEMSP